MSTNPYQNALDQVRRALPYLDESYDREGFFEVFSRPERIIEVAIPVRMDSGSVRVFTGYRSQHSSARGPYKGGIRYHHGVTHDEVVALSLWMTIKTATLGLPLGGGKGGIIVDPRTLSEGELERLSRGYVRSLARDLGPDIDVPAPDMNTNPKIMDWMLDEYETITGHHRPGTFTGKSIPLGGSLGRDRSTAMGGYIVLSEILATRSILLADQRVIVQGIGNAGETMIRLLVEGGAVIVGVADSRGAIYDPKGLDMPKILAAKKEKGSVQDVDAPYVRMTSSEILEQDADILIPAALENQITKENAAKIQAKIIIELANGPTTDEADTILFERGITAAPDILANAGGVTVSCFEQVQNACGQYWTYEEILSRLDASMRQSCREIVAMADRHHIPMRTGAYALALDRVYRAMVARGRIGRSK